MSTTAILPQLSAHHNSPPPPSAFYVADDLMEKYEEWKAVIDANGPFLPLPKLWRLMRHLRDAGLVEPMREIPEFHFFLGLLAGRLAHTLLDVPGEPDQVGLILPYLEGWGEIDLGLVCGPRQLLDDYLAATAALDGDIRTAVEDSPAYNFVLGAWGGRHLDVLGGVCDFGDEEEQEEVAA